MGKNTKIILQTLKSWPQRWMSGETWKSCDKLNTSIAISWKADTKIHISMSTLIKLSLNCQIRTRSFSARSFIRLHNCTSIKGQKILYLRAFSIWSANAYKNVSPNKENSWSQIFSSLGVEPALILSLTDSKESSYRQISMDTEARWRFSQQISQRKDQFRVG
jgi:hypothetical protein